MSALGISAETLPYNLQEWLKMRKLGVDAAFGYRWSIAKRKLIPQQFLERKKYDQLYT